MDDVDIALSALADPTRRQVIELLIAGPRRTNELAEAIGVSVPAVSRHLRLLRERSLVERIDVEGDGRGRQYQLNPSRLAPLASWLGGDHWSTHLPTATSDPDTQEFLTRVGGFLDGDEATKVIQSMIFDDSQDPWTLRFLQQTPAPS